MSNPLDKVIYLVRHCQSEGNVNEVVQTKDSPLSEKGEKQADFIAKRISKIDFDLLVSSPFKRASQTAEKISALTGKEIEYSDLFVERMEPTSFLGKKYADLHDEKIYKDWIESLFTSGMQVEDGDSYDSVIARADEAISFLEKKEEKSIVVVTHGYSLRSIIFRAVLGENLEGDVFKKLLLRVRTENTGLTVLRHVASIHENTPHWRLWVYNDHAHLG